MPDEALIPLIWEEMLRRTELTAIKASSAGAGVLVVHEDALHPLI